MPRQRGNHSPGGQTEERRKRTTRKQKDSARNHFQTPLSCCCCCKESDVEEWWCLRGWALRHTPAQVNVAGSTCDLVFTFTETCGHMHTCTFHRAQEIKRNKLLN